MAKTIQAKTLAQVSYTFTETTTNRSITDSDSYQNASNYTFSSSGGDFTVNNVARATGQLPSGGVVNIDTTAFAVEALGNSYNINFTGVKSIVIQNNSTVQGFDFNVAATGSNALTELFNGGSGNIIVKPYSSYITNDPYIGLISDSSNKFISIMDGGSGCLYNISIAGLT